MRTYAYDTTSIIKNLFLSTPGIITVTSQYKKNSEIAEKKTSTKHEYE